MTRQPTIIAVTAPRPFPRRAQVVQAVARWFEQHARRCVIVDLDPSCAVSFSILPRSTWERCVSPGPNGVGAFFDGFAQQGGPGGAAFLHAIVEEGGSRIVPGYLDTASLIPDVLGYSLRLGCAQDPVALLRSALLTLSPAADVILLVAPVGMGVLSDLVFACSNSVIGLVGCDPITIHDVGRVQRKFEPLHTAKTRLQPRGALRFVWPGATQEPSLTDERVIRSRTRGGVALEGLLGPVEVDALVEQLDVLLSPVGDLRPV